MMTLDSYGFQPQTACAEDKQQLMREAVTLSHVKNKQ
jgi:hypothetical protein